MESKEERGRDLAREGGRNDGSVADGGEDGK